MNALATPFLATRNLARRLADRSSDYDELLRMAEGKRFVLLGEATHGTREFYRVRAEITRRLITELGFDGVAIEGDWPDAWRVCHYVQGGDERDSTTALDEFERFPRWMWRNREVAAFIEWLRVHNASLAPVDRAGFYGLDLYSLYRSADAVIRHLQRFDPEQAAIARQRYAALDHVRDPQQYGHQAASGLRPSAREAVVAQLLELRQGNQPTSADDGINVVDAQFSAERNASLVVNAEQYYRAMFEGRTNTWNLRDSHMRDTLFALAHYRLRRGGTGKLVVWAHNSHLGDARATESHLRGEWNLGQLVRQTPDDLALLVGFTTYTGHVSAASEWGGEVEHKWVRPAMRDSYEHLFYSTGLDRFFLRLDTPAAKPLRETMMQRAIGVLYLPESERASHYFVASLGHQFDAVFHLDETTAIEPLEAPAQWHQPEAVQVAA